ncbi:9035_t:CDS:2 [Ambispora gerdemannii]|uniref:Kinetochore protein SPC25 n=1 Tax=Ambispora gerdemannii TaxID=144530 RepID=A0A9N9GNP4_9GLOM|nr:9035_t:CDS:2 [Ambispora gerdemannii]
MENVLSFNSSFSYNINAGSIKSKEKKGVLTDYNNNGSNINYKHNHSLSDSEKSNKPPLPPPVSLDSDDVNNLNNKSLADLRGSVLLKFKEFIDYTQNITQNQKWKTQVNKDREIEKKLNAEIKECEEKTRVLGQTLAKEATQIEEAQKTNIDLQHQVQTLIDRKTNFQSQVQTLEKELQKLQAFKSAQKQAIQMQFSRNESELQLYKDTLKMKLVGLQTDNILVSFKCISDHDSEREYSFLVDVTESQYKNRTAGRIPEQNTSVFFVPEKDPESVSRTLQK